MTFSTGRCRYLLRGCGRYAPSVMEEDRWPAADVEPMTNSRSISCGPNPRRTAMNEYGRQAMAYWRSRLPTRFSQIPDPETFFTDLGEQVASQMVDVASALDAQETPETDYLARVGQLENSKSRAREIVMAELVFLPAETSEGEELIDSPLIDPTGMPVDLDHPLWKDLEDDTVSTQEFLERAAAWATQVRAQPGTWTAPQE